MIVPGVTELQYDWLTSRKAQSIPVAVVIGSDIGGVWTDDIEEAKQGILCGSFKERADTYAGIAKKIAAMCGSAER